MLPGYGRRLLEIDPRPPQGFVYVICPYDLQDGTAKIGWAVDPDKRLSTLQTGSFHELQLFEVIPGSQRLERAIHSKLADERIRGEWFKGDLTIATIADIASTAEWLSGHLGPNVAWPNDIDLVQRLGLSVEAVRDKVPPPPVVIAPTEPEPKDDPDYIIVGETAGPPPGPRKHIPYQRPMKATGSRLRGSMK